MGPVSRSYLRLLLLGALAACTGCLAATGTSAGFLATQSKGEGGRKKDPPPPEPSTVQRPPGTFQLLAGKGRALAMGDFLPNRDGATDGKLDLVVLFEGSSQVKVLQGDGNGRLLEHSTFFLRQSGPIVGAAVPRPPTEENGEQQKQTEMLAVVTGETLELWAWEEGWKLSGSVDLGQKDPIRDLAVGDFDGDGNADLAVSSALATQVDVFSGRVGEGVPLELLSSLILDGQPIGLSAADFGSPDLTSVGIGLPPPRDGRWDLMVIANNLKETTLQLYLSEEGGVFGPTPLASEPLNDRGSALSKPRDYRKVQDLNGDGYPEVALIRVDGTSTITVSLNAPLKEDILVIQGRGGGHFSPQAVGIALVQMPGGLRSTFDRVTLDSKFSALVCSYFDKGGKNAEQTLAYELPGSARALATGHLNGDEWEDLVALSTEGDRSILATLLTQDLRSAPYYFSHASTAGESSTRGPTKILDVAFGHAGPDKTEPFLAVVDEINEELVVLYLDGKPPHAVKEERYPGLTSHPSTVAIGDLDGQNDGDEIIVGTETGYHLLRNTGSSPVGSARFTVEGHSFLRLMEEEPRFGFLLRSSKEFNADFVETQFPNWRLRDIALGPLDGTPGLDLLIPLATDNETVDHVLVVLNPGTATATLRSVRLVETLDNPKQVRVANLNLDDAPDLVIASDQANRVQLIYGIPNSPGIFFDQAGDPLPFDILEGLKGEVKVEGVATNNDGEASSDFSTWAPTRWIVASNSSLVSVYPYVDLDLAPSGEGLVAVFGEACPLVRDTKDPEAILVHDLFPGLKGPDGLPDLVIIDEADAGKVLLLANTGSRESPCEEDRWISNATAEEIGSPQRVVPFTLGGIQYLAVANRSNREILLFAQKTEDGSFFRAGSIPVSRANRPGHLLGLATLPCSDGSYLAALLAEDEDTPVVDILALPPVLPGANYDKDDDPRANLLNFGSRGGIGIGQRFDLGTPSAPEALLLGKLTDADSRAELLACTPPDPEVPDPEVDCFPVTDLGGLSAPAKLALGSYVPPLIDGTILQGHDGRTWVALATAKTVRLTPVGPAHHASEGEWTFETGTGALLRRMAPGRWRGSAGTSLFVAMISQEISQDKLTFRTDGGTDETILLQGTSANPFRWACVGTHRINADDQDDIAVVDAFSSRLYVFLADKTATPARLSFHESAGGPFQYRDVVDPVDLVFLEANGPEANGKTAVDIAVAASTGEIFIFFGNGLGNFSKSPMELYAAPGVEGIAAADLDGDGVDEILVAASRPGLLILPSR